MLYKVFELALLATANVIGMQTARRPKYTDILAFLCKPLIALYEALRDGKSSKTK